MARNKRKISAIYRKIQVSGRVIKERSAPKNAKNFMLAIIDNKIFTVRGVRVMLDRDLATVYGVETKNLNRAIERNNRRFPDEFCFRLTATEWENLKCQIGTSSLWGGQRVLPRVFSEYGAIAAATVLNSERAITASIEVVKAFVQLRRVIDNHTALAEKLATLGVRVDGHDKVLAAVFAEIKKLGADENDKPKGKIGFRTKR